ncbi:MAG TPA: hypothetical protein VEW48_19610 [Thermoanaerobaculia bacterium]|nr:hypothetical protein [Thermoanaerobaculia bacterium]
MPKTGTQTDPTKLKRKEKAMTTATMLVEEVATLSEQIMPAERGEFYAYTSDFSVERPLYFLMKCKSNKARPATTDIEVALQELDLTFIFGERVFLCSPNSAPSIGLINNVLGNISLQRLNETEIRLSNMSSETFYRCFDARSEALLVDAFRASGASESILQLSEGMTLAVRTASNKYGLVLVKNMTTSTCRIEACHILL